MKKMLAAAMVLVLGLGGLFPATPPKTAQATSVEAPLLPAWFTASSLSSNSSDDPDTPLPQELRVTPLPDSSYGGEILLREEDDGRHIELHDDQILVISLEANPSTGYTWELEEDSSTNIRQVGEVRFEPESDLLGALGRQITRFQMLRAGQTTISLVYHRPWESVEPLKAFSVQVQGVGTFTDTRSPTTLGPAPTLKPDKNVAPANAQTTLGLPSSYNWCNYGGCTSVKNQGSCGSCWAFATAGVFESAIRIQDGVGRDLSEQYLLSCNTEGWGCGGGWWAFDYYLDAVPPGEPDAGAVYESEFPYQGTEVDCESPHTHYEKITSWSNAGDIKQAIYDYGPVAAGMCVGPAFYDYSGDVFETDESSSCGGGVNHAVILVGWDDSKGSSGAWRLKNSWGTSWGESGYAWIGYGISNVGYGAAYVVYEGGGNDPPDTPSDPSPADDATGQGIDVDLSWTGGDPDPGDTVTYDVYFDPGDTTPNSLICDDVPTPACDPGTLTYDTHYYWYVIATDGDGDSTQGDTWDFTTCALPTAPGLSSSPSDGSGTCDATPTFDWSSVSGATSYHIQVDDDADFSSPEVDTTTSSSHHTPDSSLSPDTYYWRVRASNACGDGSWSAVWSLTILPPPSAPSLSSPSDGSSTRDTTPAFDWSSVNGATSYRIQVDDDAGFSSPAVDTITSDSHYVLETPLPSGTYYWRVQAFNTYVDSQWSSVWSVTILSTVYLPAVMSSYPYEAFNRDR